MASSLFNFPPLLYQIIPALPADEDVFLVGGAVRDALLGKHPHDFDFAVATDGIRAARQVANALDAAFYPMDHETGTGRVVVIPTNGPRYTLDFTSLRGKTLDEDLRARDFTINALAVNVKDFQQVFDPLGGAADLRAGRIRACSESSLEDDPVRVLRALRQATAFKFQIVSDTQKRLRDAAHLIPNTSAERIRDELLKIFEGPRPTTALRTMEILGVLDVVLPEIAALKGVAQSPPHTLDVWQHTLLTVQNLGVLIAYLATLPYDPEEANSLFIGMAVVRLGRYRQQLHDHVREMLVPDRSIRGLLIFAALYHDIGKPAARTVREDGRITFLGHEEIGAKLVIERAKALKFSNEEIDRLNKIVRHHMRPHHLAQSKEPPTRRAIFRYFRDSKDAGVDISMINLADVLATYGMTLTQDVWNRTLTVNRSLLEAWYETPEESVAPPRLVDGNDLLDAFSLSPGPIIGELLDLILESQAAGETTTREEAIDLAKGYLKENKKQA